MTGSKFRELHRRGKTYPRGVVTLSGGVTRFEAERGGRVRWPRRRKPVVILEPITPATIIIAKPPVLTIGESTFTVQDTDAYGRLLEEAYEPRVEERLRRRAIVRDAASKVTRFLVERGMALEKMQVFASEPRKTLAESMTEAPALDPVDAYREGVSSRFREAHGLAASGIADLRGDLGEDGVRRVYAAIYAVSKAQDAAFTGDEALFADAITLAGRATCRSLQGDRLRHLSITSLTDSLCAEVEEETLRIFDETGEDIPGGS
jgi:hypothetical protein